MQHRTIQLAVIDMAGTTVADDGLVVRAFEAAGTAAGLPESGAERDRARQYVLDTMGQSKITVFRALFETEELAQRANAAFEASYEQLIDDGLAKPIDGAAQAITRLRTPEFASRSPQASAEPRRRSCSPRLAGSPSPTWCSRPATVCGAGRTPT